MTSRQGGEAEVDPAEVELRQGDVDAIWRSVENLYRQRLHPAIALCVRRRGKVVLDRAIGHIRGNSPEDAPDAPTDPATPASFFNLFSATKMVTAMLLHLCDQRRLVHLDDPVAEYIPEFAARGKAWITLRHVLTHRSGIPAVQKPHATVDLLHRPNDLLGLLCDMRPAWPPGRRLAYHALTGGYILAEVIQRVTGKPIDRFLRDEITGPLGFRHFRYGVEPRDIPNVAENAFTGPPVIPPISTLLRRALGVDAEEAVHISNDPSFLTAVVPAGNLITTANEASRFMQLLLDSGEQHDLEIFEPRTVHRAIAEQSYLEIDLTLGFPVRYGMGFMLGADYLSPYGWRTPRAFGHLGFTNVIMYADPVRDISVALLTSGKPLMSPGQLSWLMVMQTIARRCPRDWGR